MYIRILEVIIADLPSKHWLPVHPTGHSHVSGATHTPGSGQSAQMAEINVVEYGYVNVKFN